MRKLLLEVLTRNKKKNVVLYGAQKMKRDALEEQSLFRLYEMELDEPVETGDEPRIYSFEQAAQLQVDAFVILRQMIANQGTFQQMLEYCQKYDADIYDENGRNIGEACNQAILKGYSTKQELMEEIDKHEFISFDIFDTLLTRKVLVPDDVFILTERKLKEAGIIIDSYKEKRLKAQSELGLTNPDIYEIYKKFQAEYGISDEVVDLCINTELEIEKQVLMPREDMIDIFNYCIQNKKTVSLVSDMYIPEELLVLILHKNKITGYSRLYISCDEKQLKLQGLLESYQKECDITDNLHIGDHLIHDGICAGLAGMDYCLVENSYKAALRSGFKMAVQNAESIEEHIILGMAVSRLFNSPFVMNENNEIINIQKDYDYGYGICAPLLSQFAIWVYKQVECGEYDDILFASRDGYLIQKLYRKILDKFGKYDMPKGKYFYTSRKAAVMTGINNEAFINMIMDISYGMHPRKMMRERFGLSTTQILDYDEETYGDSIHQYVWDHAPVIFARADKARKAYFKYMGKAGLEIGKRYAFMDFVSSGTSQKSLMRIAPFEMCGLYAGWNSTEDMNEVGVNALFTDHQSAFLKRFKLMETFMTSEEPSLSHFDDNGEPIFDPQDRSEEELQYVRDMHTACIDFLQELLDIINPMNGEIKNSLVDSVYAVGESVKIINEDSVLNHLTLMDDWRKKKSQVKELLQ